MTDTPNRARLAAQPDILRQADEIVGPIKKLLFEAATRHGLDRAERWGWIAAMCVLLESGMLTDQIARAAAVEQEWRAIVDGGSAQAAHVQLAEMLGMTRQGIESRLTLTGRRPGPRGAIPIDELRRQVYPADAADRENPRPG